MIEDVNHMNKIERIVLDVQSVAILKSLSEQISNELGDLVQVTQKSIANFLIRKRSTVLSSEEISQYLKENYDVIRALKHATAEAIKARQNGDDINFEGILKLIQTPSVKSELPPKTARGRKKKPEDSKSTIQPDFDDSKSDLGALG